MKTKRAQISCTYSCNMKCSYCNLPNLKYKQLTIEQWIQILDKLKTWNITELLFSGGEPFLYKNLNKLIQHSLKLNIFPIILTNGSFYNNIDHINQMQELYNSGVECISTSIDNIPQINNKDKSWFGYNELQKLKTIGFTKLGYTCVCDPMNSNKSRNLLEFMVGKNFECRFQILQPKRSDKDLMNKLPISQLSTMKDFEFKENIKYIYNNIKRFNISTPESYFNHILNDQQNFKCDTPSVITIDPSGNFQLCGNIKGNINQYNILDTTIDNKKYENLWYNSLNQDCAGCFTMCHFDNQDK